MHSFRIVSDESPETMRKLWISTKFPHQEIRWNYGIIGSDLWWNFFDTTNYFLKNTPSTIFDKVLNITLD